MRVFRVWAENFGISSVVYYLVGHVFQVLPDKVSCRQGASYNRCIPHYNASCQVMPYFGRELEQQALVCGKFLPYHDFAGKGNCGYQRGY